MLTRLRVKGFKNLVDVDVRFGPFTCIAGANGVGKSNLFDAIRFLSALTQGTLLEAAFSVRNEVGNVGDIRSLFHQVGDDYASEMSFDAEMIIPHEGIDELGQKAEASSTFLRYSLSLTYTAEHPHSATSSLRIKGEELTYIKIEDVSTHILFKPEKDWIKSAIRGRRTVKFIETISDREDAIIQVRQDQSHGRPLQRLASNLPRTVLSTMTTSEYPTAMLARQEMQSWKLLQLEPAAMREPDQFLASSVMGSNGSHLAAALFRLAHDPSQRQEAESEEDSANRVYAQVANRLSELLGDLQNVQIDRDEKRQLLILQITAKDGSIFPARSLSDGTLRFLALTVINLDTESRGVLCLEEPENGIHPARIPAMLELLQEIATDTTLAIGTDNPLRQVIINTHSPAIVQQISEDDLLCALPMMKFENENRSYMHVVFKCLPKTWREITWVPTIIKGEILSYLQPVLPVRVEISDYKDTSLLNPTSKNGSKRARRRVIDRADIQKTLELFEMEY